MVQGINFQSSGLCHLRLVCLIGHSIRLIGHAATSKLGVCIRLFETIGFFPWIMGPFKAFRWACTVVPIGVFRTAMR